MSRDIQLVAIHSLIFEPDFASAEKIYNDLLNIQIDEEMYNKKMHLSFGKLMLMASECKNILSNYRSVFARELKNIGRESQNGPIVLAATFGMIGATAEDEVRRIRNLYNNRDSSNFAKEVDELREKHYNLLCFAYEFFD